MIIFLEGTAFGNVQSFVDGTVQNSTGTPYFYVSELDASQQDIAKNPRASFTVSEVSIGYCAQKGWDPEDPRCAKVVLSGKIVTVTDKEELTKFKVLNHILKIFSGKLDPFSRMHCSIAILR